MIIRAIQWIFKRMQHPAGGFTLIETFVAIGILATALAGALSLAAQGFNSADIAGDQITASFLAQDAVEYIRFARDSACLADTNNPCQAWLSSVKTACENSNGCFFDSSQPLTAANPQACTSSGCPPMYYDKTSGFYNYAAAVGSYSPIPNASVNSTSNKESKFTRTITIITPVCPSSGCPGNGQDAQVTVFVDWSSRGQSHDVKIQEDIFNWEQ